MSKTAKPDADAQTSQPSQPANAPSIPADVAEELARLRAERDAAVEAARAANADRDAAVEFAQRADVAARAATRPDAPTASDASRPLKLRALHGIVFSIRGERHRLRTGETIDAAPADLEDDGLVFGRDFEIAR